MKHQQFEEWLFSDEPLSEEEQNQLAAHLEDCQECQLLQMAYQAVEHEFSAAPMLAPPEGFMRRFNGRLEKRLKHEHRIQSFIVVGIASLVAAASLILLLLTANIPAIPLADIFSSVLTFLTILAAYMSKMFNVGLTLLSVLFGAALKLDWLNISLVIFSLIAFSLSSVSLRTSKKGVSYE